jgi:hypothetical protein
MSFESGSVSLRMFYRTASLAPDFIEGFARNRLPPIDSLGNGEVNGWVTGRHLLDSNIVEETAMVAGYLRLSLVKAERKIPQPLLRAECKMEELAEMQARDLTFLKRNERSEIKKAVTDRLLPNMPPTLTSIDLAGDTHADLLFASALSDKQLDAFRMAFRASTDVELVEMTPQTLALRLTSVSANEWGPVSFSPDCPDEEADGNVGREFLTWLWYFAEKRGGLIEIPEGEFGVMIEGPLMFVMEGQGAHETVLRKGMPLLSSEAKSALLAGKKLRRAKLTFVRGDEQWQMSLDADEFVMRSVKLPKSDNMDASSKFQDRILALYTLYNVLAGFFRIYIELRMDAAAWETEVGNIRKWVGGREERK